MARMSIRLPARGIVLLGLALTCSPLLAQQQTVYQWKDSAGVTHYADAPPKQAYKKRDINARSGTALEKTQAKKSSNDVSCDNARANLANLRGKGPVGIDNNGDGKADANMSPEQRASQVELNEAMLKANCAAPATGNGTTGNSSNT
ncbi:DUF4124 domain-containing protein [Thermomonas sp.]|uniref:DUF4124 domain-containing protein n=1 Tax=Thermomonas sp. TaxID=1971895 RepID=UPI002488150D|nr:DUF4124 domain-containing protein [Thermomonas sp.]MDI1254225.1 DUF4124 domain-containing protein [Thermomonas sp.]